MNCCLQRVRRSVYAQKPDPADGQDMTVTMRNWESNKGPQRGKRLHSSFSLAKVDNPAIDHSGPELLLTPIIEYISNRDDSPARSRFRSASVRVTPEQTDKQKPYSLAITDIMFISTAQRTNTLNVTTLSSGLFEFTCHSGNGYDILLAFLQASLDPERIINDHESERNLRSGGSSVTSCLDIDALQAQYLEGRAAAETWPEKLSRRVGHVFQNLSQLSGTICDGACCPLEQRTPPETSVTTRQQLEIDNKSSPQHIHGIQADKISCSPRKRSGLQHLPSGLSVESDPETISTS